MLAHLSRSMADADETSGTRSALRCCLLCDAAGKQHRALSTPTPCKHQTSSAAVQKSGADRPATDAVELNLLPSRSARQARAPGRAGHARRWRWTDGDGVEWRRRSNTRLSRLPSPRADSRASSTQHQQQPPCTYEYDKQGMWGHLMVHWVP